MEHLAETKKKKLYKIKKTAQDYFWEMSSDPTFFMSAPCIAW